MRSTFNLFSSQTAMYFFDKSVIYPINGPKPNCANSNGISQSTRQNRSGNFYQLKVSRLVSVLFSLICCASCFSSIGQTRQTAEAVKLWERGLLSSKTVDLQVSFYSENVKDSASLARITECISSLSSDLKTDSEQQSLANKLEVCLKLKNSFPLDSLKSIVNKCGGTMLYLRVSAIEDVE